MLSQARGSLVAIQARDFARAVAFYKDVLGLPMTFRHENTWAEFRAPGLSIGIEAAGDGSVVGGGTISICFEVAGIDDFVDRLKNRGVSFLGRVKETIHGKEAYFTDSEGNPILLHQSLSEPGGSARGETGATAKPRAGAGRKKPATAGKGAKGAKGGARGGGDRAKKPTKRQTAPKASKSATATARQKRTPAKSKGAAARRGSSSRRAKR